ncbi:Renal dipeptidase [Bacillus cereus]|uniref:nucleotidyltransferase domain-containing protein n=1 Tax=Bacillus cereus TaxID=1396 RepID=UPI000BF40D4C|nr:nucleotidyltransferase family protein [Bacillus cereus]PFA18433.1 Renal dipeptidase [Bacillus cereus]
MDNKFELDLTLLSKEFKLLLELLKEDNEEGIQKNKQELFSDIDWEHFLYLARHHRVYPLMYVRLKSMDKSLIPQEVIETLCSEYRRNTFQMLQLSGEMERLNQLFHEHGIQLLLLKGPVIAQEIYGDISLRTSKDLDILIKEINLEKVENVLLDLGYVRNGVQTILNERKWRHHHVSYFHPKKCIEIEIHWKIHPFPMKQPSFDELWQRRRVTSLMGSSVCFLGKEDLFLYLIVHGARHGWFRLRWLKDIDQMFRRSMDFERIYKFLEKYKYHIPYSQVRILLSILLHTPMREKVKILTKEKQAEKLAEKAYIHIINSKQQSYISSYLISLETNSQRLLLIISSLYPCFKDVEIIKLPKYLHFLYFPLRPFLWTWRKTKHLISS